MRDVERPETGIVGPVQSRCEPITSTNGVSRKTVSPVVSVPMRYGQRRRAGARQAATSSTTQIAATESVCVGEQRRDGERSEQCSCGRGAQNRYLSAVGSAASRRAIARRRARARSRCGTCGSRRASGGYAAADQDRVAERHLRVDDAVHLARDPRREPSVLRRRRSCGRRRRTGAGYAPATTGMLIVARRPVAVVPPQHVAGVDAHLGRAAVPLDPVDEEEPVALRAERAGDAVDRLDVAAAVPRRHLQLPLDRLDRR